MGPVGRVVGVIQARMGSSRLPGKVLARLADRTVLEWVVRAVRSAACLDDVVIATTREQGDDAVAAEGRRLDIEVVRGERDDVLARFLSAIKDRRADGVARFTADCPLLDPCLIASIVAAWRSFRDLDHLSTANPRCLPRGLDVEVADADALHDLDRILTSPEDAYHRVHVTSYLYSHPERYRVAGLVLHPDAADLRVTLDTKEDLELIEAVVSHVGDRPPQWREIVALLRAHPVLRAVNAHVSQKGLTEG